MSSFGFSFGDPGIGGVSGGTNSGNNWADTVFKLAQLGTQTYLADQAINNSRPATIQYAANGTPVVTGGGALAPAISAGLSSGWLIIGFLILLALVFIRR